MPQLNELDWDSQFFGMKVARVDGEINSTSDLDMVEAATGSSQLSLTYLFQSEKLDPELLYHGGLEIQEVGSQLTFSKAVSSNTIISPELDLCNWDFDNHSLKSLSISAGTFSRFHLDPRIENSKFQELYELWIQNSVLSDLADKVYVYRVNQQAVAMITLGKKNSRASIGLIAVNPDHQGKGIGRVLLEAAEHWANNEGFQEIEVITQGENEGACKFYESYGFSRDSLKYVYHIWNTTVNPNKFKSRGTRTTLD